jgi:hypothetical protein
VIICQVCKHQLISLYRTKWKDCPSVTIRTWWKKFCVFNRNKVVDKHNKIAYLRSKFVQSELDGSLKEIFSVVPTLHFNIVKVLVIYTLKIQCLIQLKFILQPSTMWFHCFQYEKEQRKLIPYFTHSLIGAVLHFATLRFFLKKKKKFAMNKVEKFVVDLWEVKSNVKFIIMELTEMHQKIMMDLGVKILVLAYLSSSLLTSRYI